jgi:hypothetical protein
VPTSNRPKIKRPVTGGTGANATFSSRPEARPSADKKPEIKSASGFKLDGKYLFRKFSLVSDVIKIFFFIAEVEAK